MSKIKVKLITLAERFVNFAEGLIAGPNPRKEPLTLWQALGVWCSAILFTFVLFAVTWLAFAM